VVGYFFRNGTASLQGVRCKSVSRKRSQPVELFAGGRSIGGSGQLSKTFLSLSSVVWALVVLFWWNFASGGGRVGQWWLSLDATLIMHVGLQLVTTKCVRRSPFILDVGICMCFATCAALLRCVLCVALWILCGGHGWLVCGGEWSRSLQLGNVGRELSRRLQQKRK
jgi:hypothetical protein